MAQERRNIGADAEVWAMIDAGAAYRGMSTSAYLIAAGLVRSSFDFDERNPDAAQAWRAAWGISDELVRRMNYRQAEDEE